MKARLFERVKEIDYPLKLVREILLASPLDEYLDAGKKAGEFTKKLQGEGIVRADVKDKDVRNALQHFIASYSITREFGSPRLTWELGDLNEIISSPLAAWRRGESREELLRDTEIDYYHNQLGIEEAVKSAGKDVPLYELVRRLAKAGH